MAMAGCSGGGSSASDPATQAAATAIAPSSPSEVEDVATDPNPVQASDPAVEKDTGPAAAAGQGSSDVNGTTYALTIASCKFNGEGLPEGKFEVNGKDSDGHDFEMTQFYLNGDWSQSDVQLDLGPTKIYVIRSSAREGAAPAVVDGQNVTWVESYRELDDAANGSPLLQPLHGSLRTRAPIRREARPSHVSRGESVHAQAWRA